MQKGTATFTLDYGQCPPWLFERMVKLGRSMVSVLIEEYGPDEFIKRISNPVWFQSLGTVLAFDWNASGLTTILTAALKEAIRGREKNLGVFICGGKGKTSRKTPEEIATWGEKLALSTVVTNNLIYNSRMSAKVDSSLVQDGFTIYHHAFFFSKNGAWGVIQQGMNTQQLSARRYHWYSPDINDLISEGKDLADNSFVNEPHQGIVSPQKVLNTLNMTDATSAKSRNLSVDMITGGYSTLVSDIEIIRKHASSLSQMITLKRKKDQLTLLKLENTEFRRHPVEGEDFWNSPYLDKILKKLAEGKPENYEQMLATPGVGPKTIRALALVGEIIYGAAPSYEDPARYSFAHGGKDSTPYPVDRSTYDQSIQTMSELVRKAKINPLEKDKILSNLASI
jgi:uncharacterized protein